MSEEFEEWWSAYALTLPTSNELSSIKHRCYEAWKISWEISRDKYIETYGNSF